MRGRRTGVAAGVGVLVLVVVMVVVALRAEPAPAPPASPPWSPPSMATVWPAAGEDADAVWRRDPARVARRFLRVTLGWSRPALARETTTGPTEVTFAASPPCPDRAACPVDLRVAVATDPAGTGATAVWSVVGVTHVDLEIAGVDAPDASPLTVRGPDLTFALNVPKDRLANIGVIASNGCRDTHAFRLGVGSGTVHLAVPAPTDDDPACSDLGVGYVFAYVTDALTVPVGDPLREAATIEYPWLTIVPAFVQMERPSVPEGPDVP